MRNSLFAIFLLAVISTTGCSRTLSRDKAAEIIRGGLEVDTMFIVGPMPGSRAPEDKEAKRFCAKYKLGTELATVTVEKVTGIVFMDEGHRAIVEFQRTWKFDTEAGKEFGALPTNVQESIQVHTGRIAYASGDYTSSHAVLAQATFVLYDDGWRLKEIR
jgi:hypothetical protein